MYLYREINAADYRELASLSVWEMEHAIMILLGYTCDEANQVACYRLEVESDTLYYKIRDVRDSRCLHLEIIIKTAAKLNITFSGFLIFIPHTIFSIK